MKLKVVPIALLFACCSLFAQQGPYATTVNISEDLGGVADGRPTTWGTSQAWASPIKFNAPPGFRARILRVSGDFVAYPRYPGVIPAGTSCEIGWGLKTTAADGSQRVTYPGYQASAFDNSLIWLQGFVGDRDPRERLAFDTDVSAGGRLEADDIVLSQAFIALNTTGLAIHLEATFTVVYQFEAQ
jgi:hypothetical protein